MNNNNLLKAMFLAIGMVISVRVYGYINEWAGIVTGVLFLLSFLYLMDNDSNHNDRFY